MIGVQESRRPQGRYETSHYIVLASGAQVCQAIPHFGCELWLHKSIPVLVEGSLSVPLGKFNIAVAHADSRRLVVHLQHATLALSFVVLHAPCRSAQFDLDALAAWWDDTTALLHRVALARLTWFCVDANAPLASADSPQIGLHGHEPMNEQGLLFESFIHCFGLFAPTTMEWCHQGDHHTWTHPRGLRLRRDYVLCSADAFQWCQASWVASSHDGGFAHEDHLPVCLHLRGWWTGSLPQARVIWDRCAFLDPARCEAFQAALQSLPMPCWDV